MGIACGRGSLEDMPGRRKKVTTCFEHEERERTLADIESAYLRERYKCSGDLPVVSRHAPMSIHIIQGQEQRPRYLYQTNWVVAGLTGMV